MNHHTNKIFICSNVALLENNENFPKYKIGNGVVSSMKMDFSIKTIIRCILLLPTELKHKCAIQNYCNKQGERL